MGNCAACVCVCAPFSQSKMELIYIHLKFKWVSSNRKQKKKNAENSTSETEIEMVNRANLTHILPWYINFPVRNRKIFIYRWTARHNAKCNRKTQKCLQ